MRKIFAILLMIPFMLNAQIDPRCDGTVSLVGEFNGWGSAGDLVLTQSADPNVWTGILTISTSDNLANDPNIIEVKFRLNADWIINWGGTDFPAGFGYQDGPNILVPVNPDGTPVTYYVTFNCSTGEYIFIPMQPERCDGIVGLVGEFNGWGGNGPDVVLTQSEDPHIWTGLLTLSTSDNAYDPPLIIYVKFRLNEDWAVNWGAPDFPFGYGVQEGVDIPVPINPDGSDITYYVTFNCATGEYSFVEIQTVPVSNWALYIGILLMTTFVLIRFRKMF